MIFRPVKFNLISLLCLIFFPFFFFFFLFNSFSFCSLFPGTQVCATEIVYASLCKLYQHNI